MQNYKLVLSYDGTRYRGWQRLEGDACTIQSKVEQVLSRLAERPVQIQGSGRTDAGVHAKGQVASFCLPEPIAPEQILAYLREYLPEDIGAVSVEFAPERFHARLNAVRKTYSYRLWTGETPCVFERRYVYCPPLPLDTEQMRTASLRLFGTHDFAGFCSRLPGKKSTVRTIERIEIIEKPQELELRFTGDGFLNHMVRILTGTLIEIGDGRSRADSIDLVFQEKQRALAGYTVPAKGLCLERVEYE